MLLCNYLTIYVVHNLGTVIFFYNYFWHLIVVRIVVHICWPCFIPATVVFIRNCGYEIDSVLNKAIVLDLWGCFYYW